MTTKQKPEILVTGAGGELAHHVIKKLRKKYDLIGVDFRKQSHYDDSMVNYRLDFSKRGFEEVFKHHQFEGVIHLGRIFLSHMDRYRRYNTNVLGTQKLFDFSIKYGVKKCIVLSTYHVYGAHPYNPSLLDESFPLKASNISAHLADAVELENLSAIYMVKHPQMKLTVLRPCNVIGPGVRNSMSQLLQRRIAPYLVGFSPVMQFLHVDDLAEAIVLAYAKSPNGVYNVAPNDWIPYPAALQQADCQLLPIPSLPPSLPRQVLKTMRLKDFPVYLMDYFKYPVILDGTLFRETFGFLPQFSLDDIFSYYAQQKV